MDHTPEGPLAAGDTRRGPGPTVDEEARLAALRACFPAAGLRDPRFDDLARLASRLLDTAAGAVTVIEHDRQWFAGARGFDVDDEVARQESFCAWAIQHPTELFVVSDAATDPRFADNPYVTSEPGLRFYAGIPVRTDDGHPVGVVAVLDTNARPGGLTEDEADSMRALGRAAEALLRLTRQTRELDTEHRFLQAVLDNVSEGIIACDDQGRLNVFNAASEAMHGLPADVGLTPEEWAEHYRILDDRGRVLPTEQLPLRRAFRGQRMRDVELWIGTSETNPILVRCNGQPLRDDAGNLLGAVVTMRDVTDERAAEAALRHRAERDPLTGLFNRTTFEERLRHATATDGDDTQLGVLFLDLDDFKVVNDTHGHAAGDELLEVASRRLRGTIKDGDSVARMGGDEFVVLCRDVDADELAAVRERVAQVLDRPYELGRGARISPAASVGMAHSSELGDGSATLVELADRDMYRRKQARRAT
ncbi:MAG TPA: diguanylate cyclase [Egicoccus sp.]|nr:diguanylate cyclase [Egicoccus sp.]HSK22722.1 diguanylate cyclase [Egicoccus sp.]